MHIPARTRLLLARLLCLLVACLPGAGLQAHEERASTAGSVRVLGKIDFPTSAKSPEAPTRSRLDPRRRVQSLGNDLCAQLCEFRNAQNVL